MQLIYFARIREIIGCNDEKINLPDHVTTVGELLDYLSSQDEKYSHAFKEPSAIRIAVNQNYASFEFPIGNQDEIAIFPPMTGG
jgi:molybdopterin synthase sulfur carrier subunit